MSDPVSPPRSSRVDLIFAEDRFPLEAAASFYPDRGFGPPCLAAVVKHAVVGVAGWRLETMETSAGVFTSREAIERFIADVASERPNSVWRSLVRPLTSRQLARAPEWARRLLAGRWA